MKLGIDVGGTFTDLYGYEPKTNAVIIKKALSTPGDFKRGVFNVIEEAKIDLGKVEYLVHGSTICTNAIIERTCPTTFLITTEGFQDLMTIGRYHRRSLYDPYQHKPTPLVKRRDTFGVPERTAFNGDIIQPLDKVKAREVSKVIKKSQVRSVCVAFQNSYANPNHEKEMESILKADNPNLFVSLSSTVPKIRELKRFTTACVRAMLWPVMGEYVQELTEGLESRGFRGKLLFVANNGGMMEASFAIGRPELMLLSGPAAGIGGSLFICRETGKKNILTADMGGTSCDISIQEGTDESMTMSTEREIDFDMPLNVPTVDVRTIGAGGGSIAWIDKGGSIRVGPQSAGAVPGPACYRGGGTEATVTDANLLLGRIGEDSMSKGGIRLDTGLAEKAVGKIASALNLDPIETSKGIIRIVNENMAATIRQVSLERGRDPRNFCLLAAGAAGPMHAAFIAEIMGIPEVIIPSPAGVLSAFGATIVDVRNDSEQTFYSPIAGIDEKELNKAFETLDQQGRDILGKQGISREDMGLIRKAMMRYIGQTFEVETPVPLGKITKEQLESIERNFHEEHKKEYGFSRRDAAVAFVDLRSTAIGSLGGGSLPFAHEDKHPLEFAYKGQRQVFFEGKGFIETPIYEGERLTVDNFIEGPAVIEWRDFTGVIPPKRQGRIDHLQNIIIRI